MPSDKQKGGGGVTTPAHRPSTPQDAANNQVQGNRRRGARHVLGQTTLPSFVAAEALAPSPGRTKAVLIVRDCPCCGGEHVHRCDWPTPKALTRKAGCGARYDVYPFRARATRRGRRAA